MRRTGLLLMKKSSTGMRVVLSLMAIGVSLWGCQVPPSSATADANAPASPQATANGVPAYVEHTEAASVPEGAPVASVPEETEEVPSGATPINPHATETTKAIELTGDKPDAAEPAVVEEAASWGKPVPADDTAKQAKSVPTLTAGPTDEGPNQPPVTTQVARGESPASVVTDAMKTSIVAASDAKVYVVNDVYDFGELTPLEKPSATYQIKNIGTDTLHLTRVKVCCGAQYKLSSETLQPGETCVLTVTYVATTIGKFEKYLNVYSNDINTPNLKLTIKGNVVRHLAWTPDRFKLMLDRENGGCAPVKIWSTDGKPFSLTLFSATEDCLVADIDPNKIATEFVIQPKVDLKKLGSLKIPKGVVRIAHTHPGCDVIKLYYDLIRRYAFAPKRFLVLNADPRQTKIQRLTILDNYADSLSLKADGKASMFAIESVVCENGAAVLKSTKQVKDGFQLTFEIKPPAPAGQRLFQDMITIKLSIGNELQVPVNGIYSMAALAASQDQK